MRNPEFLENLRRIIEEYDFADGRRKETLYYLIIGLIGLIFENFIDDKYCVQKRKYLTKLYELIFKDRDLIEQLIRYRLDVH